MTTITSNEDVGKNDGKKLREQLTWKYNANKNNYNNDDKNDRNNRDDNKIIITMEVTIPDDGELVMTMNTDRNDNDDDDDNCKNFLSSRLINGRMNEYKTRRK